MKYKYIVRCFIVLIFIIYWLSTAFYNMPDNYIKAKNQKGVELFSMLFEQSWQFFAPPPDRNMYLYFQYNDHRGNNVITYEINELLSKKKREELPFNSREEILDYIVGGALGIMNSDILYRLNKHRINNFTNLSDLDVSDRIRDSINADSDMLLYFNILKKLSKTIVNSNLDGKQINEIASTQIIVTEKKINKFIDRNKESMEPEKVIIKFNEFPFQKD